MRSYLRNRGAGQHDGLRLYDSGRGSANLNERADPVHIIHFPAEPRGVSHSTIYGRKSSAQRRIDAEIRSKRSPMAQDGESIPIS